jgi:hypothetical protein
MLFEFGNGVEFLSANIAGKFFSFYVRSDGFVFHNLLVFLKYKILMEKDSAPSPLIPLLSLSLNPSPEVTGEGDL